MLDGEGITIAGDLLAHCVRKGVAVVVSDRKHLPSGILLPISGNTLHTSTLRSQIEAGAPATKRAWQKVVRAKIAAQADMLQHACLPAGQLRRLIPFVRSGDPDNVEARAAVHYFERLFGEHFLRADDGDGINSVLNYGYALIRAAVARAIVGAGLHPAIGIHHRNQYNAFCLADDAMEPLRPIVDHLAWHMGKSDAIPLDLYPAVRKRIAAVLTANLSYQGANYPLLVGLERYAASLRRAICDGADLEVPIPVLGD